LGPEVVNGLEPFGPNALPFYHADGQFQVDIVIQRKLTVVREWFGFPKERLAGFHDYVGSKICNLALIPELLEALEDAIPGRFKNNHCQEKGLTCFLVLADTV
jgi:hypothetical protein